LPIDAPHKKWALRAHFAKPVKCGVCQDSNAVEPSEIVAEFWSRIQARDWDGLSELLEDGFVVEWPNARLRIRGRDNFVGFNRSYPEGWSIEVLRILAQGDTVVSEVRVPHPTVGPHYAITFLEVRGGKLLGGREYWMEEQREEPPAERARWFEELDET
jgi:ketosteroid isomerase-like protein